MIPEAAWTLLLIVLGTILAIKEIRKAEARLDRKLHEEIRGL